MQLRLFITFFLLCFHGFTYGQKTVISNFPLSVNTKAFATLQEKVFASYLLLDSIEALKINDKGVIFFKFNIISGKIKNLNQSGSAPDFFKENIAKYLLNINDLIFGNIPIYKNEVFILPIQYDYRTATRLNSIEDLLNRLPNENNKITKFGFEDFNSLFGLDGKNMYGIKCTLLTPLSISRPIE